MSSKPRHPRRAERKPVLAKAGPRETKEADAISVALSAFAHEVRTPLTGILAVSDLLATSDLGERERRWAQTIRDAAEHLSSLTTLFVDAARGQRKTLVLRQDTFDLRRFAETLGQSLAARTEAKGLTARIRIPKSLPQHVRGDVVRLRAALENLIDNAVKFTDRGEVGLTVKVSTQKVSAITVAFEVTDRGIGLTLPDIAKLFRPFSQASLAIAQRFGGAGLGLASARLFARAMGGDIVAAPRKGGGAVFTLTTQLTKVVTPSTKPQAKARVPRSRNAALRILAVEDNPYARVVLNAILTELGHRTDFVARGEEALDKLKTSSFDVVLMDMVLPGLGGVAAIKRIRAHRDAKRLVVIGISGRETDAQAARKAGADAFLVKPVAPRLLAQTMAEAIATRKDKRSA